MIVIDIGITAFKIGISGNVHPSHIVSIPDSLNLISYNEQLDRSKLKNMLKLCWRLLHIDAYTETENVEPAINSIDLNSTAASTPKNGSKRKRINVIICDNVLSVIRFKHALCEILFVDFNVNICSQSCSFACYLPFTYYRFNPFVLCRSLS